MDKRIGRIEILPDPLALARHVAGWMTAALTRRADFRDVLILAALQFAMTLAVNVMLFDRRLAWFYGLTLILPPLAIVAGGRLSRHGIS